MPVIVAFCLFACRSGPATQPSTETGRWIAVDSISELNLLGVDMVDQRNGFAVGDIGLMNGAFNPTWTYQTGALMRTQVAAVAP